MTIITIIYVYIILVINFVCVKQQKNSIILYYIIVFRQWPKDVVHACSLLLYYIIYVCGYIYTLDIYDGT